MAYFVADEKLQGYYVSGGATINIVKYHFECDNTASLPAQTAFISSKKVKISMASTAHTIDTDTLYKMDSSGAWVQQSQPWKPLADYSVLTKKPQINGHTLTGNQTGADLGLQNMLTFDSTPTQSSTNPVTSGGIWTDQQRQDTLQSEDRATLVEIVDNGDKNKLQNTLASGTVKGITYTINADGSITTAAGTATSNSNLVLSLSLPAGRYVLSGCPNGGSGTTYRAQVLDNTTSASVALVTESTEGNEFEVVAGHDYAWRFRVQEGKSIPAATFYPMICTAAAWKISTQYQPYRPSWQEMYDMILALQ